MDLDSRKNEAKSDLKRIDMQIEASRRLLETCGHVLIACAIRQEVLSRALITIGELKTQVEESRWEKLKAAVGKPCRPAAFVRTYLMLTSIVQAHSPCSLWSLSSRWRSMSFSQRTRRVHHHHHQHPRSYHMPAATRRGLHDDT